MLCRITKKKKKKVLNRERSRSGGEKRVRGKASSLNIGEEIGKVLIDTIRIHFQFKCLTYFFRVLFENKL